MLTLRPFFLTWDLLSLLLVLMGQDGAADLALCRHKVFLKGRVEGL